MGRRRVNETHEWVGAAYVPLDSRDALRANRTGNVVAMVDTVIDVVQISCRQCRRAFIDVANLKCEAFEGNDHLIGGPTGERKKRAHNHDCALYGCITQESIARMRRAVGLDPGTGQPTPAAR